MASQNIKVFHNAVKSISQAPCLILLCPEDAAEWCNQYTQEGYNVLHIPYPGSLNAENLETARKYIVQQPAMGFGLITFGLLESDVNTLSALSKSSTQLRSVIHYCPAFEAGELMVPANDAQTSAM